MDVVSYGGNMRKALLALMIVALSLPLAAAEQEEPAKGMTAKAFKGLEFRSIGPALMSGRIADIAIHPSDFNTWYVAVGSGGVWKTTNSGTTWKPIFDEEKSYSIGCVVLDPSNPEIVWVGSGENVGGRHVAFGDGVYRSDDGGASWKNMGLKDSQHISEIVVDPTDSKTVYVASQGPLWSAGGDRGLYKTTDGGATWQKVLSDGEWTGVTDVVMDSRDPQVLYAATWQHHRTVAAVVDGGPETGIYRTGDGGATWTRLTNGLPKGNMGKIGLAISPQNPDVVYAVIELDNRQGGTWRSSNRGASWEKRSDAVSGGTGPHYYQELEASPHAFDRIYIWILACRYRTTAARPFGGSRTNPSTWTTTPSPSVPTIRTWLLVGTDGGIYETFDLAENWRFVANLPVTQFYKLAVDDAEPFYNVYGGTQDNNTQGGPTRTDNVNGITNADWFITLFADGHQPAVEPGNPDIVYSEWQEGNLVRYRPHDRRHRLHPAPARARRPARALQLGRSDSDQPAFADPALLRLAAGVALGRSRRRLDPRESRSDQKSGPDAAAGHGPPVELDCTVGFLRDVGLQHHHLARRVARPGGPAVGRHRRRPAAGERGRR